MFTSSWMLLIISTNQLWCSSFVTTYTYLHKLLRAGSSKAPLHLGSSWMSFVGILFLIPVMRNRHLIINHELHSKSITEESRYASLQSHQSHLGSSPSVIKPVISTTKTHQEDHKIIKWITKNAQDPCDQIARLWPAHCTTKTRSNR